MKIPVLKPSAVGLSVLFSIFAGVARAEVINVAEGESIADAITAAKEGDTIEIDEGTYVLSAQLVVDKPITLKGAGPDKTFIDGGWDGVTKKSGPGVRCLKLNSANAKVCDLTIRRAYSSSTSKTVLGIGLFIDTNGGTVENCVISNCCRGVRHAAAVGVYMNSANAVLKNCIVSGNECYYNGNDPNDYNFGVGVWVCKGVVSDCVIEGNTSNHQYAKGAGVYMETSEAFVTRSVVRGNSLSYVDNNHPDRGYTKGAGVYVADGVLENCLLVGNKLSRTVNHQNVNGGGLYQAGGKVVNCTIAGNEAVYGAGAFVASGTFVNNIVFGNTAYKDDLTPDYAFADEGVTASHCCFPHYAEAAGVATRVQDSVFALEGEARYLDDYSIDASSVCCDKGLDGVVTSETDLFGNARVQNGRIDIGAAEAEPSTEMTVEFTCGAEEALNTETVHFAAKAYGPGVEEGNCTFVWTDGNGVELARGKEVDIQFEVGVQSVTLTVTCGEMSASTTQENCVTVADGHIFFNATGSQTSPYNTPELAFTNLAEAVDYARDGSLITLGAGTYNNKATLAVSKRLRLEGAGPDKTIFETGRNRSNGTGGFGRVFQLNNAGAVLSGVRVDYASGLVTGTGVFIGSNGGTLTNCWVTDCSNTGGNAGYGAGVYMAGDGLITHCKISGNRLSNGAAHEGAGVWMSAGRMENCLVVSNTAVETSSQICGGVYAAGGTVVNCTIAKNSVYNDAGVCLKGTARAVNCLIYGNEASSTVEIPDFNLEATNRMDHCCLPSYAATLLPPDARCVVATSVPCDPVDYTLTFDSICSDAGSDADVSESLDYFGATRIQGACVDIGAGEATPSAEMVVSASVLPPFAVGESEFSFAATVKGGGVKPGDCTYRWTVGGRTFDTASATCTLPVGQYEVALTVTPPTGEPVATVQTVCVYPPEIRVEVDATPAWPYDGKANAFTNPLDAVDFCVDGMTVRLGEGSFALTNTLTVSKALTLVGAGMDKTEICRAKGTMRVLTVDNANALVSGLQICGGNGGDNGSGVYLTSAGGGTVDGCRVTGCSGNSAVFVSGTLSHFVRSVVCDNSCRGVNINQGGWCDNCLITRNTASYGAGVCNTEGSQGDAHVRNCTIIGNVATSTEGKYSGAGVYFSSTGTRGVLNCLIYGNTLASEVENPPSGYPDAQGSENTTFKNCYTANELTGSKVVDCIFGVDPKVRGNGKILSTSPCARKGAYQSWMDGQLDLFGNPRVDAKAQAAGEPCVDIGCCQSLPVGLILLVR